MLLFLKTENCEMWTLMENYPKLSSGMSQQNDLFNVNNQIRHRCKVLHSISEISVIFMTVKFKKLVDFKHILIFVFKKYFKKHR